MSSQLPVQLTRFIGWEQEIGDITRLLTLIGPGGYGKTHLAAAGAAQVKDNYEDSVLWVDLAPITDESLVSQAVAKTVNVKEQPSRSIIRRSQSMNVSHVHSDWTEAGVRS